VNNFSKSSAISTFNYSAGTKLYLYWWKIWRASGKCWNRIGVSKDKWKIIRWMGERSKSY